MSVSDKTRKILWARSGNRCAICRQKLVVEETPQDPESVVGEECHISSRSPIGPRFNVSLTAEQIDGLGNLMLLCATHHKMVDDQFETYTVEVLCQIRDRHNEWVETKFSKQEAELPRVVIKRFKQNIPEKLSLVTSGRDLFALASDCSGAYHHHDTHLQEAEVELVGSFFQEMQDWSDLSGDLDALQKLRAISRIDSLIKELSQAGFLVFSGIEMQRLEGGVGGPADWRVLHLSVSRADGPDVEWVKPEEEAKQSF